LKEYKRKKEKKRKRKRKEKENGNKSDDSFSQGQALTNKQGDCTPVSSQTLESR
jgi:hypothetical protein